MTFLPEHIEAIDKMVRIHHLLCLSFTNCNIEKSKNNFKTLLNSNVNPINVLSMHFSSMNFKLYPDLSSSIFKLTILSLRGCCLQLSFILSEIKNTRITKVDFSKNRCTEPIPLDAEFPRTLSYIAVNDIKWNYANFSTFIKIVAFNPTDINLSIAKAEMTENDWIASFDLLGSLKNTNLTALIWRENPIHYKLRDFISQNTKIWFASFAGCHTPGDGSLQNLISSSKSLRALDLHGTANSKLGDDGYSVLSAVLKSDIEYLDVSNNDLGNKCVYLITQLISSPNLKQILIDNNYFNSIQIAKLFQKAILNKKPKQRDTNQESQQQQQQKPQEEDNKIYVKYPENDFAEIPKTDIKQLKKDFLQPLPLNNQIPYHEPWNICLSQKFEEEKDIKVVEDPDFVIPDENQFLSGSKAFWDISLINQRMKEKIEQNVQREQISWELNTVDIPVFDTSNIENQLSSFFSLENNTERLILSW